MFTVGFCHADDGLLRRREPDHRRFPSAIQLFAWITTIVTGTPDFKTPLLFIVGFIVYFIIGGLSGITLAAIPFDQQVHDSYYVVAHFHFVIFGAAVFPILGGMYFWFPKVTGRMYHEGGRAR